MKKHFCFSAMICMLLSVFVFSADAIYSQEVVNAKGAKNTKWQQASNANASAIEARGVMGTMGAYYSLNAQEINKGKRMTLGSVLKGVATVTVTYVSGGSTLSATVIASMEPALKSLGLVGSINTKSDLESAYESAISELSSRISEASAAIARYKSAWQAYRLVVLGHNSQYHGSDSSLSDPAHTVDPYEPPKLNTDLPKFPCPDGSCGLSWLLPSSARTAHYAKCGTKDDPYDKDLKGCYKVFYTCNTKETARHKPQDCGLEKWVETSSRYSKTSCPGDYRECTRFHRDHSTFVRGVNGRSMCGPASGSGTENPVVSPTPTPTPTPPSPTYHACGAHETSVSGDHSLQASCPSTDSNGNSCTVTNFYACDSHTHSYPSPPPKPKLKTCSGCNATYDPKSSAAAQHTPGTFPCGVHSGRACSNRYTVEHSTPKTCHRPGCGATFYSCNRTGPCVSDWGTFPKHSAGRQ